MAAKATKHVGEFEYMIKHILSMCIWWYTT